jgi:hypothetical protein
MILTAEQSSAVLAEFGCFVKEICDKCGTALGAVRFTRKDDHRAWCSRACRGDSHAPGECQYCHATLPARKRKGSAFCDDTCRQASHRSNPVPASKLSVTNRPKNAAFRSVPQPGCYHPTTEGKAALERAIA